MSGSIFRVFMVTYHHFQNFELVTWDVSQKWKAGKEAGIHEIAYFVV